MTQGLAGYTGVRFPTSRIGFNEAQYLASNPDVALMVQQGLYPSAQAHYETVGRLEGRVPLTGGNQGQTVAAGLQRYYNNLGLNGQSPFTQTPTTPGTPAAQPTDPAQAVAAAPPVPYTPVGAGGGSEGLAYDQTSAPTTGINTNAGKSLGSLGQIGGAMLGAPLVGAGLTALGTKFDVDAANATLAENNRVAQANNPTVNYSDALKNNLSFGMLGMGHNAQAQRALEQQREYDKAMAFSNLGSAENAAAEQAAIDAAAQQDRAEGGDWGGRSDSSGYGPSGGGGYGGTGTGGSGNTSDGSGSNSYGGAGDANGGFIRALYAMGGLAKPKGYAAGGSANIMPWDRVNADADAQGLAAWSPYEASSAPLDAGAPIVGDRHQRYEQGGLSAVQPGNNPIHAAMGTQVAGPGDGRSDNVPAMLSADEYVIPADVVAALGDGSSNAGAKVLADLVVSTRDRYRRKLGSLPPPKA